MFVRYHTELSHVPAANFARLSRTFEAWPELSGSRGLRYFVGEMRKIVKRVGPYDNHMTVAGLSPEFRFEELSFCPNSAMPWQLRLKPAAMLRAHDEFSPHYARYYGWNASYLDQMSAIAPWELTDYDAAAPGGGRFSEVLRNNCILTTRLTKHYDGPVWSEGQANHFYAGYLDTGYMQTNRPEKIALVDYTLREMNSVMRANGYDLFNVKADIDFMLSAEISLGSMGHIWDGVSGTSYFGGFKGTPAVWRNMLKSYFMLRQLQTLYAAARPERILYAADGKEYSATELLRRNIANSGMIHTIYDNGLQVWANRNPEHSWNIEFDGKPLTLPPFGYAALQPGTLVEYSAEINGKRVDYSSGPMYVYCDARDNRTAFPEMTVPGGAYLLERLADGRSRLVPQPFLKAEKLENLRFARTTPCDRDGAPVGPAAPIANGELAIDGKAFGYILE